MATKICYIAAAGAGKTTHLISKAREAIEEDPTSSIAIITLTIRNQDNIIQKIKQLPFHVRKNVKVLGWYEFLLRYIIRPYKGDVIPELYEQNVGLLWSETNRAVKIGKFNKTRYKAGDLKNKFLCNGNKIYKNFLSEFAFECIHRNPETSITRLGKIFSHIFIDESQDLAGYDLDVVKFFAKSDINLAIVGDPRQHTYSANNLSRHPKYKGRIDEFIKDKINGKRITYIKVDDVSLNVSHRCAPEACELATQLYPNMVATVPCSCKECYKRKQLYNGGDTGVFFVEINKIEGFIKCYNPVALTPTHNKEIHPLITQRFNMGESKGLGFNACLIYPTDTMLRFLKSGKELKPITCAQLYVAITRATHIVGIVVPDGFKSKHLILPLWDENCYNYKHNSG